MNALVYQNGAARLILPELDASHVSIKALAILNHPYDRGPTFDQLNEVTFQYLIDA